MHECCVSTFLFRKCPPCLLIYFISVQRLSLWVPIFMCKLKVRTHQYAEENELEVNYFINAIKVCYFEPACVLHNVLREIRTAMR